MPGEETCSFARTGRPACESRAGYDLGNSQVSMGSCGYAWRWRRMRQSRRGCVCGRRWLLYWAGNPSWGLRLSFGKVIRIWAYLSVSSNSWNCGSASSISFSRLMNAYSHVEWEHQGTSRDTVPRITEPTVVCATLPDKTVLVCGRPGKISTTSKSGRA